MSSYPMHIFDSTQKGRIGKPARPVRLTPTTQNDVFLSALLEMPTTKNARRSPLQWVAATGLHIVIFDPTGQLQRHSLSGPSRCTAPASTSGGAGRRSAHNICAPESHLLARKTDFAGLHSEDSLS
jgi:hypothetical protein